MDVELTKRLNPSRCRYNFVKLSPNLPKKLINFRLFVPTIGIDRQHQASMGSPSLKLLEASNVFNAEQAASRK